MSREGKVAKVIDQYEVIVNIGSDDGVEESDEYIIYELSDKITDPDTGEDLGQIEYKKRKVHPEEIYENKSVMRSSETTRSLPFALSAGLGQTKTKKLTTNEDVKSNRRDVKRGDRIRLIQEESEDSEGEKETK